MTSDEFRKALSDLGQTQAAFARFIEVDERTVRRWATDGPPRSIALLLGLMQRFGVQPADL